MTVFKDKKLRSEFADEFSKLFIRRHNYFSVTERFFQQGHTHAVGSSPN
jgi:hypothetical protein